MSNPFIERGKSGSIAHGRKSEKRVSKDMGARQHPNSGAMQGAKSDASLTAANFRLEMKSTVADALSLEMSWLVKIAREALSHGQNPAVVLSFVTPDGKTRMPRHAEWVCLPLEVFKELTGT